MKNFSKVLSLLLAVCMVMGTFCTVFADEEATEVTLPSKLLDLNLDNMAFSTEAGSSGITNAGTSETATITMYSTKYNNAQNVYVNKNTFTNNNGEQVDFLHVTNPKNYQWNSANSVRYISDNAWETQANTISFWADLNTTEAEKTYRSIVQYRIVYDNNGTEATGNLELAQANPESYNTYNWSMGNTDRTINMNNSKSWSHVVITNPTLSDGSKEMKVYINGEYKRTETLSIPEGSTLTSAALYFAGHSYAAVNLPSDARYGDVAVYDGVLTDDQITKLYTDSVDKYVPIDFATVPKLIDLNIDNMVKDTANTTGNSGIVNDGTSTDAQIIFNSATTLGTVTKEIFVNSAGMPVEYIHKYNANYAYNDPQKCSYVIDNNLEQQANTISFWTDYEFLKNALKNIFDYKIIYDNAGTTVEKHFDLNIWPTSSTSNSYWTVGYSSAKYFSMANKTGWNHVVITNPVLKDGSKTMDVYVNGVHKTSLTIEISTEATLTSAELYFGGQGRSYNSSLPKTSMFSDIDVYKGTLLASDIKALYDLQAPKYEAFGGLSSAEKMLELNLDGFCPTTTEGSSGITNTGTSEATLDIHSTSQVRVQNQTLMSADLTTAKPYIWVDHNFGHVMSTAKNNHFDISDPAWGDQPVTLSFWADVDRGIQQKATRAGHIMQYDLAYTLTDGTTANKAVNLWQWDMDTDTNYRWATGYDSNKIFSINNDREWTHVAIVIPDTKNNQKKVPIYINGALATSVTLDIPEGAVLTNATLRFGGGRTKTYVPADMSVSDVKVYKAYLTEELVNELYENEKATYDNSGEAKITFAYNGSAIERLGVKNSTTTKLEVPDDGTASITVNYTDTITPSYDIIVAAYDTGLELVSAKKVTAEAETTSGSFEFTIQPDTKFVKVFVWEPENNTPIQKITDIRYNDN